MLNQFPHWALPEGIPTLSQTLYIQHGDMDKLVPTKYDFHTARFPMSPISNMPQHDRKVHPRSMRWPRLLAKAWLSFKEKLLKNKSCEVETNEILDQRAT